MIEFYDENMEKFESNPLRFTHDGHLGGTKDILIYLKNNDLTLYYTGVVLNATSTIYNDIVSEWGETGFGIKFLYGSRRPTETEWDQVKSGESISLPDIGSTEAADTANYYPIWIRTIVPGKTSAQIKTNMGIKISAYTKEVGS